MANPWLSCPRLPRHAAAVLGALHLEDPARCELSSREWKDALDYADRERLTMTLREAALDQLPDSVRRRVDQDAARNRIRLLGIEQTYRDLVNWLGAAELQFVFLKGITHSILFGPNAPSRVQYDFDLWLPRDHALAGQQLLLARGYHPLPGTENLPTDHLPALARKTGWQWRGDFFDPEIPLPIELHVQFWNTPHERFTAPGVEAFWERRAPLPFAGISLPALHPADALAYACLHVLKHVLTGSVRIFHVYEIAAMLHGRACDTEFWKGWREQHPAGLRRLQAIVFRLAREWFGGQAAPPVREELALLPANIRAWFEEFAASPAAIGFQPNKDHLWLHQCLVDARRDAWAIALQRLFPRTLPAAAGDSFVAREDLSWRDWLRWRINWLAHTATRASYHTAALPATLRSGIRWWRRL